MVAFYFTSFQINITRRGKRLGLQIAIWHDEIQFDTVKSSSSLNVEKVSNFWRIARAGIVTHVIFSLIQTSIQIKMFIGPMSCSKREIDSMEIVVSADFACVCHDFFRIKWWRLLRIYQICMKVPVFLCVCHKLKKILLNLLR